MSRSFSVVASLVTATLVTGMAWAAAPATNPATSPATNPSAGPATNPAGGPAAPGAPGGRRGRGGVAGGAGGGGSLLDQVAVQGNDKSRLVHEHLLIKAKLGKGKIDVYFQGDSIFRRWGVDPEVEPNYAKFYANWKENFWGWNAADFAWGADTIQNILWRMRNGELDDVNPKVVVFLGGTNNVATSNNVEDMTKGLVACFDEIHKKAPNATLIIVGILPRQPNFQATIDAINANLAKLADGKKTRFVNVKDKMLDKNGQVMPGMLADGLHPDVKGYQVIADAIKPILTELLGPPAKEDHAPPPSWDVSVNNNTAPQVYPKPPNAAN